METLGLALNLDVREIVWLFSVNSMELKKEPLFVVPVKFSPCQSAMASLGRVVDPLGRPMMAKVKSRQRQLVL